MGTSQQRGSQLLCRRKASGTSVDDPARRGHSEANLETRPTAKRVLFVDDDAGVLKTRQLLFEVLGYKVLTADSGEGALEMMRLQQVDAVVLDYLMPGMDGEDTARTIRSIYPDIPIISSSGALSLPLGMMNLVDAAVEKGTEPPVLIDILEQQLRYAPGGTSASDRNRGERS